MYLCSTQAPAAEIGHASWQTGTPETKSTTFGDRRSGSANVAKFWILFGFWIFHGMQLHHPFDCNDR